VRHLNKQSEKKNDEQLLFSFSLRQCSSECIEILYHDKKYENCMHSAAIKEGELLHNQLHKCTFRVQFVRISLENKLLLKENFCHHFDAKMMH